MANKQTLLKLLTGYTYIMLVITSLFFVRSVTRHYRQAHSARSAMFEDTPSDDGELPLREVNPLLGWNETTVVLPFMLLYTLGAYFLTMAPFPTKRKKVKGAAAAAAAAAPEEKPKPQVDYYNRRSFGTACIVVASFLFLILTLSFFVQDKLENQMMMGEDQYRRDQLHQQQEEPVSKRRRHHQEAQEVAEGEGEQQLELHSGEEQEQEEEQGQCSAGGDMSHAQIVLSSLDVLFELVYAMFFGHERDDGTVYHAAYKKAEPDQNSYYYNFSSIQRTDVLLLHVGGLVFSLYCLFAFDADDAAARAVPTVPAGREKEPQEKRDNPALTMDALKSLGAGATVPRAKKTELLAKDDAAAKKKQ